MESTSIGFAPSGGSEQGETIWNCKCEDSACVYCLQAENERLQKIVANLCPHSVLSCAVDCKCLQSDAEVKS